MSNIIHTIRLMTSASAAIAEVQKYKGEIVGCAQTIEKHANTLSGDKLLKSANEWAAAVAKLGGASNGLATSEQLLAGASKLTANEKARLNATITEAIEKYRVLGQTAPPAMLELAAATKQAKAATDGATSSLGSIASGAKNLAGAMGIGLGVGALVSFTKGIVDSAGHLVDLSEKTGLSLAGLQRFQYVAAQTGTTVDAFADASFKLGIRIAEGSDAAKQALSDLGLSYAQMKGLKPDEQFDKVAEKLGVMKDATQRNELAVRLYGQAVGDTIPAMVEQYQKLKGQVVISTDEQIKALDRWSDRLAKFASNTTASVTGRLGLMLEAIEAIGTSGERAAGAYALYMAAIGDTKSLANVEKVILAQRELNRQLEQFGGRGAPGNQASGGGAWGDEALAGLDKLRQLTAAAKVETSAFTNEIRKAIIAADAQKVSISDIAKALGVETSAVQTVIDAYKKDAESAKKHAAALAEIASIQRPLNALAVEYVNQLAKQGISETDIAEALHVTVAQVKTVTEAEKVRLDAMKTANTQAVAYWNKELAAAQALAQGTLQLLAVYESSATRRKEIGAAGLTLALGNIDKGEAAELASLEKIHVAHDALYFSTAANIKTYFQNLRDQALGTADTIVQRMNALGIHTSAVMAQAADDAKRDYEQMKASGQYSAAQIQAAWKRMHDAMVALNGDTFGNFKASLADLPNVILRALEGGGDVYKAVSFSIGAAIGKDIGAAITKKLGGEIGSLLGPAIGSVLGSVVGTVVDGFISDGWGAMKDFATSKGGFPMLHDELKKLGAKGEEFWQRLVTGSPGYNVDTAKKYIKEIETALAQMYQANDAAAKNAKTVQDILAAQVQHQHDLEATELDKVNKAIEKYGITIAELGPKWQQQKMNENAQGLLEDFTRLIGVGVKYDTVITKMGGSLNEYARLAKKTGVDIPESFRPIFQRMIELGQLTDENGVKIDSLDGYHFSESLDEQFRDVIQAIKDLITILTDGLGGAIKKIPPVTVKIRFEMEDAAEKARKLVQLALPGPSDGKGGIGDTGGPGAGDGSYYPGLPGFAGGTYGQYPDFGSRGTVVRLHNRERVMTEAEGRSENAAASAPTIHVTVNVMTIDADGMSRSAPKIADAVAREVLRSGGLRTKFNQALQVA